MNEQTRMDMSVDMTADVSMAGEAVMQLSMPMDMKMDMDLAHMDQSQISMTGKMEMTMDEALVEEGAESTISQDVAYYYTDGVYYMDLGEQKVKMPMSFEDVLGQISGLDQLQTSEPICMIDSISTSGSTTTVAYSARGNDQPGGHGAGRGGHGRGNRGSCYADRQCQLDGHDRKWQHSLVWH